MEHEETPGLGANAIRPDFYSQFDELTSEEINLKKNNGKIDAITGATITTNAVINGVKQILTKKLQKLVDNEEPEEDYDAVTEATEKVGLANPASVYCEENNGTLDIRDTEDGQVGYCIFEDGSECEEWAFYKGECNNG
jgi:putative hemolysin